MSAHSRDPVFWEERGKIKATACSTSSCFFVPGAGQPYLLRPFRYGNKFQGLCNLLIMACYQKDALFINFWFCIWFCIRLSDKERMRLQHFRVLFCRDLDILHKVRFLFVPCNLHNGNSWNPGLICVCSE